MSVIYYYNILITVSLFPHISETYISIPSLGEG